jgi:hypothetical protein
MTRALVVAALLAATPAWADDDPRFCVNRPSIVDTPCTVEPGRVLLEVGAVDWTLDKQHRTREDTIQIGDMQARIGFADHAEFQLSWTAYAHDRLRTTGMVSTAEGVGDVRLAVRRNLVHPDGSGFSVALEPYVTVPVGGRAIGAGEWGFGAALPLNYDLSDRAALQFTGSLDAVPDQDRSGRHFSSSGAVGLSYELLTSVFAVGEVQVTADDDPIGHTTQSVAAASLAWQPTKVTQLDLFVGAGLNRDTPDVQVAVGGAILF